MEEHHYYGCECSDFGHVIRFSYDPDDGMVSVDLHLNDGYPWWRRLREAIKYVIGIKRGRNNASYDSVILKGEDLAQIHALLDRAQACIRQETARRALSSAQVAPGKVG